MQGIVRHLLSYVLFKYLPKSNIQHSLESLIPNGLNWLLQGSISEVEADSFNLPMYLTSPMEFRELIEANGCFIIERMENFNPYENEDLPDFDALATQFRAATEGLIREHFGIKSHELMEDLYDRFADKMADNTHLFDMKNMKEFIIFACLKRKNVHFNADKNQN